MIVGKYDIEDLMPIVQDVKKHLKPDLSSIYDHVIPFYDSVGAYIRNPTPENRLNLFNHGSLLLDKSDVEPVTELRSLGMQIVVEIMDAVEAHQRGDIARVSISVEAALSINQIAVSKIAAIKDR
jgi:hypothetical protein